MKHVFQQFHVVYREEDGWFIASVPALPGCHTQGKTLKQTEQRIKEAIEVYLESVAAHKELSPQSRTKNVFVGAVVVGA